MPSTMTVVEPRLPESMTSEDVELTTTGPFEVLHEGKLDMTLEHEGVVGAELVGWCTQRDSTCDVRRAIQILTTAVEEKDSLTTDGSGGLRMCAVVDDSTIAKVATDRTEAISVEELILGSELIESDAELVLSEGLTTA